MHNNCLNSFKDAYIEDADFYDENVLMLQWYAKNLIHSLKTRQSKSVLSLGIGHQIVSSLIIHEMKDVLENYCIVEGSNEIIQLFRSNHEDLIKTEIIYSMFEDFVPDKQYDAIEMGFVLEHVDNPHELLRHYSLFLKSDGIIYIAVPNARSLHRLVGNKAGILKDIYVLSDFDLRAGHKRYFDIDSIKALINQCNLHICKVEGIFLKSVSSNQMRCLRMSEAVLNGFFELARDYPEISNAIYIEAHK